MYMYVGIQVICAHAMSVAPTEDLSAEISGYLPVHCVHQLIKMRTFRKHGVSIKVLIMEPVCVFMRCVHAIYCNKAML